jgi:hypothetical protein
VIDGESESPFCVDSWELRISFEKCKEEKQQAGRNDDQIKNSIKNKQFY